MEDLRKHMGSPCGIVMREAKSNTSISFSLYTIITSVCV